MSDDLINFLRARLTEDEAVARRATPGPWRHNPQKHHHIVGTPLFEEAVFSGPPGINATCVAGTGETDDPQSMADAEHIARHDPARVLREVEAIRGLLGALEAAEYTLSTAGTSGTPFDLMTGAVNSYRDALRHLATTWADHPDYQDEWRP